jgi:hypothetical protein
MNGNRSKLMRAAVAVTSLVAFGAVGAQAQVAPATPAAQAEQATLTLTDIEQLLKNHGVRVTELEVKDRVVEAEGYDAQNRKVEVLVDRRSGEVLWKKLDD